MRLFLAIGLSCVLVVGVSEASAERASRKVKDEKALAKHCPTIRDFNPRVEFWKNNKPIRAGSYLTAPVIGQNPVMTYGLNAGQRGALGRTAVLYAGNGKAITTLVAYPCRSDHCGGRVVSSLKTFTARRKAVKEGGGPTGYLKVSKKLCIKIDDLGRCFGNEVDKGRPLCDRVVK